MRERWTHALFIEPAWLPRGLMESMATTVSSTWDQNTQLFTAAFTNGPELPKQTTTHTLYLSHILYAAYKTYWSVQPSVGFDQVQTTAYFFNNHHRYSSPLQISLRLSMALVWHMHGHPEKSLMTLYISISLSPEEKNLQKLREEDAESEFTACWRGWTLAEIQWNQQTENVFQQ